jgi:hypothetical protein
MSNKITKEQFAKLSFEYDRDTTDKYNSRTRWSDLPKKDRQTYLDEAETYINEVDIENWPIGVLERLEDD